MGGGNIYSTATYIAGVMERVDAIFRNTVWNIDYEISGMGFELAEMKIETNASNNGYNAAKSDWDPLKLLQAFGHNLEYKKFCVAHLFTYEKFDNNVLGLAYIAPTTEGSVGGMCSLTRFIDGQETALNTGWSSSKDSTGETVLTRQAELVTAHELGHNWGAEHDPDTSSCSPSAVVNNGKYLMYAYSVTGYDTNNDKFSPCSRRDIGAVLAVKAQKCFSETPENTSCGNGLKDDNEECDAGYIGRFGLDPCCTKACRFSNGSVCSPVNFPCCFNCQLAPQGFTCQSASDITCLAESKCNGYSYSCPEPANKLDNSTCLDEGLCRNGSCLAFCEARGLISCACNRESESCQRCCRVGPQAECTPYIPMSRLPNGRPCVVGYCLEGACKKTESSVIQRLFDVFENLTVDGVLDFFRKNVVGCIIVFSLIFWIPISCCVSFQDRKKRNSLIQEGNRELQMNGNKFRGKFESGL
ncbi:ADAM 17-like protease isoform X2 [Pomacea canaliculata]|uniref:ADAM 17-like protease isoform X2 n=1 Tax=Pomacea canaliculata TaxID=400727 RepID=UPI000D73A83A|nr:ADAM 17-like protease isoform X2 [Pomacea canaliculata]